jgi:hypothetical protein
MDEANEWHEEWNHEVRARDHSLRQIGAIVLALFDELDEYDKSLGRGRTDRSTPLGRLLHDTATNVENYHVRTKVLEDLKATRPRRRSGVGPT